MRVGSGVYVMGPKSPAHADALPADSGPFELIRARWLIEAECAALAARHATKAQVRAMEEALDQMAEDCRRGSMPEWSNQSDGFVCYNHIEQSLPSVPSVNSIATWRAIAAPRNNYCSSVHRS